MKTMMSDPTESLKCYAVKVCSRREEAVAKVLRTKHYEVLLPTYRVVKHYSDRTLNASRVLFTGYVFVRMNPSSMLNLVSTDGVAYVVRSASGLLALSDAETHMIEALCTTGNVPAFEPCSILCVGQRVRIEAGPFTGLEGVLMRVRDVDRVAVTVETLHSAVSIEISHTRVRLLDAADGPVGRARMSQRTQEPLRVGTGLAGL